MPLPGSHREPQFLQEIKEPKHEPVQEPVVETLIEVNGDSDLSSLVSQAEALGIAVKSHWNESQLSMAIRLRKANK
ncbi:MAG: hypothetical protein H8D23_00690 [Candidatus Brocadiales bacterium]|nr:hypothetical protein [Candidatus Brocadiales bacterium]